MRVICIDDSEQFGNDLPKVKKGNIYTIMEKLFEPFSEDNEYTYDAGYYYVFIETGRDASYHESVFIEINENQLDETERIRETNLQKVKSHLEG